MKDTEFVATVFKCSGCSYKSLQKPPVEKHIKAKCSGATLVKEQKLVKHRDLSQSDDDIATLYQCSKCEYTSQFSTNVKTHISSKCQGAEVLSEKRKLIFEDVPKPVAPAVVDSIPVNDKNIEFIGPKLPIGGLKRHLIKQRDDDKVSIFYLIRPHGTTFIKFGIAHTEPKTLKSRYTMYYGKYDIEMFECEDNAAREKYMKGEVVRRNLSYCKEAKELALNTDNTVSLFKEICELEKIPDVI